MLRKIAVLNSKVYGKAVVRVDDCDSLQLVGPNNIGKSTLIYALNFLFIIDGNKMTFSGQRKGDKETIHHYFPTPNQSYIIFEIFKGSSYCILIKRDTEGELEYYHFKSEYRDDFFFREDGQQQRLLKFDEVQEKLAETGLDLQQFKNKSEVFSFVYSRGTDNEAIVWLEENVKSDGLSNNFSKVYRYLINSKLITNKTLKEALIIADNRENEVLNFSQKNKKDIIDLLRLNDEIKNIKSVKMEFLDFREIVNQYESKSHILSEMVYAFDKAYTIALPEMEERIHAKGKEINELYTEIHEFLRPKEQDLNRRIGQKESDINNQKRYVDEKRLILDEINAIESMEFLAESLENLEQSRKEIESQITQVESQRYTSNQIKARLDVLAASVSEKENQARNYNDLLIHKISDDANTRKILNTVLSERITSLNSGKILEKVKKATKNLKIFDGEIDISSLSLKEFKSIDEINDELYELRREEENFKRLLDTAKNGEQVQENLKRIKDQIEEIRDKIKALKTKPQIEKEFSTFRLEVEKLKEEKENLERELKDLMHEIMTKEHMLQAIREDRKKTEERINQVRERKQEVDFLNLTPVECEVTESLDQIYNKMKLHYADRAELKSQKDKAFDALRHILKSSIADETEFIRYFEEEIACLVDKEKSIDGLLQSISTQFANPAYTLMKRYEEFKQFIYTKFNTTLAQTRISNIESLQIELLDNKRILGEIAAISSIQEINGQMMLEFDQTENLRILNNYLDNSRKIHFDELFDIELHLEIKGTVKKVDLANQVESDGTDRMIRLVIIMSIINRLAVNHNDNRITLFIDEVATIDKHNRPELVKFCRDHNFIPIFAAPDPVPGFSKYYFIYPSKGKININERLNAIYSEPLAEMDN
jgi:DNA repair exonuclease SbcCD ATPase subunit